jgi:hypothetical protein
VGGVDIVVGEDGDGRRGMRWLGGEDGRKIMKFKEVDEYRGEVKRKRWKEIIM